MMTSAQAERALAEVLALPRPRLRDLPRGAILTDYSEEIAYLRAYIPWMRAVESLDRWRRDGEFGREAYRLGGWQSRGDVNP